MRSTPRDERAVPQDHNGEESKALGIARTMSKNEIAELAAGPPDYQDRHAARGYEVAPSTLVLERGQMLCGVLDGYGPPEDGVAPTLTMRRSAGSMWIVVPLKIAQECETAHRHGGRGQASP